MTQHLDLDALQDRIDSAANYGFDHVVLDSDILAALIDRLRKAEAEAERYRQGMANWKATAEAKDAYAVPMIEALKFYANGDHFYQHDPSAWDTVSGEPVNFQEDEACTATVEDGSIAKMALDRIAAPDSTPTDSAENPEGGAA